MSKIAWHVASDGQRHPMIQCPGCGELHMFVTGRWTFNGDEEKPTFAPSMLATSGHYVPGYEKTAHPEWCWCNFIERFPDHADCKFKCYRCHSFVTDGKIQFLSDCSHALAGQTVDLPDFDKGW